MAEPFLAEIRIFSFGFPPKGWTLCNGQLLPINQNQALFALLGTNYGGDGRVNFGLPNLQGNVPIHMGAGHTLSERGGEQGHTLSISEIPTHTHTWMENGAAATQPGPTNAVLANAAQYSTTNTNLVAMQANQLGNTGGSQAHLNMQPFLVLNMCIALQGIFPSQT